MTSRPHIPLRTKLAAALCNLVRYDEDAGTFVPVIPHEEAKRLSEQEVLSRFHFDHWPDPEGVRRERLPLEFDAAPC